LNGVHLGENGARAISCIKTLKRLNIVDDTLVSLTHIPDSLEYLAISCDALSPKVFENEIARFTHLKELELHYPSHPRFLTHLHAKLPSLKKISYRGPMLARDQFEVLTEGPWLQTFEIQLLDHPHFLEDAALLQSYMNVYQQSITCKITVVCIENNKM
jgi:hypothetical protein